jgi:outer membrane receptor protein involved in Fe transport
MWVGPAIAGFRLPLHRCRAGFFCLLATGLLGQAQASDLQASTTNSQPTPQDRDIIVTGSRIPRSNLTAISPVIVVQGNEFELSGAVMAEDLLNSLPQVVPDQGRFISNGATGTSTVDLRGLGPGRTLVLINGRRLLPGDPFVPVPDINAVPTALIKRVEVLTGGASSVYGSDAIAGVVNFILDTQLDGLRVKGQASVFQHDNRDGSGLRQALRRQQYSFPAGNTVDGDGQDINAAYGTSFAGDRGHATIYAGYRRNSSLTQDARDYSACTAIGHVENNGLDCGGSVVSARGTFFRKLGDPLQVGTGREFVPGITPFNFAPYNYYQRPDRRYTAGAFAEYEISPALQPFLEFMFMDDRTTAQIAPSGSFGDVQDVNCDNPLLSAQQRALTCFRGNYVGETPVFDDDGNLIRVEGSPEPFIDPVTGATYFRGTLFIGRRNVEGGPRIQDTRHKNLRLLGGLRGDLSQGVTYETSLLFGRVKFNAANSNDLSISRMRRSVDVITDPASGQPACRSALTGEDPACVPWDVFAPASVTAEAAAYLEVPTHQRGSVKQWVGTAFANLSLDKWGLRSPWADEGASANIGAEYRKDQLSYRPDAILSSGDVGDGDLLPVSGATIAKELFAEGRIPIITDRQIENLSIEVGYRQSWQSNSENKFRVNSYKLGLEFAPLHSIRFRASLERAVRAPNIQELFLPTFPGGFNRDPCASVTPEATPQQCANTGVTASQYGSIIASPNTGLIPYNATNGGNPALDPEKGKTKSLGVVLSPRFAPGLNATIDWFDIAVKGAIGVIGPTIIMNTCLQTADPLFCSRIHRDADGSLWMTPAGFIDNRNANIGSIKIRGIDVGVAYARSIGRLGSLDLGFLGSWLDRATFSSGGQAIPFKCAGAYGFGCGVPKPEWRLRARATWTYRKQFSLSLQWRYVGSVRLDRSIPGNPNLAGPWRPGDQRIGAQSYFDLTGSARVSKNYELRVGVNNLFDREPPITSSEGNGLNGVCGPPSCNGNTFPQLYDPLGRYLFAGVTIALGPF